METAEFIELLGNIKITCLVLAGVLFIASIIIFFLLDMKKVLGDLTGYTAKREIENIRAQNIQTGNKSYKPSSVNRSRGKITSKITDSGKIIEHKDINAVFSTERIGDDSETSLLESEGQNDETTVLQPIADINKYESKSFIGYNETTVLNSYIIQNETTVLEDFTPRNETVVLEYHKDDTEKLDVSAKKDSQIKNNDLIIYDCESAMLIQEILFINTSELILLEG